MNPNSLAESASLSFSSCVTKNSAYKSVADFIPRFDYQSISLERQSLRLVQLFGGETEMIRCQLFDAWLDDPEGIIEYDALSYTWGDQMRSHAILINDKVMPFTHNLSLALRALRYSDQDRILWIDAVCIDQWNSKERGHQVMQMSTIYEKAHQVVVWLGPSTLGTDLIMDQILKFGKEVSKIAYTDHLGMHSQLRFSMQPVQDTAQRARMKCRQTEDLLELLDRPWFDRVWIIQEIANARSATIVCGTKSVSARVFALVPMLLGITPKQHSQAILDIMPGSTRKNSWWARSRDLFTLLNKFGSSKASDPRDKIYALLGISSDASHSNRLKPDYEKVENEVVHDTITCLLDMDINHTSIPHWNITEFLKNLENLKEEVFVRAASAGDKAMVTQLVGLTGLDVNYISIDHGTALSAAAARGHEMVVKRLLNTAGIEVGLADRHQKTPLFRAAATGHGRIVQRLLDTGISRPEARNSHGWTALWKAAIQGNEHVVRLLISQEEEGGQDIKSTNQYKIHKALVSEFLRASKDYWHGDHYLKTPICWAAQGRLRTIFKLLLELDIFDVNTEVVDGYTLIGWLAHVGEEVMFELVMNTKGFDFATLAIPEDMLLDWAVAKNRLGIANQIIESGKVDLTGKGFARERPFWFEVI